MPDGPGAVRGWCGRARSLRGTPSRRSGCASVLLVAILAVMTMASPARGAQELTVPPKLRLLVIAPHPDDESLGAGGLMQRTMAQGGRVHVLFLTSGDGYPEA